MRHPSGPEAYTKMVSLLDQRKDQYADALIQALIFREGGKLKPFYVRICIRKKQAPKDGEFRHEYPEAILLQKTLPLEQVKVVLERFANQKQLEFDGLALDVDPNRAYLEERDLVPGTGTDDSVGWAHSLYIASLMNSGSYPQGPLIAQGLPAFPHASYAARKHFGIDLNNRDGRQGTLNIMFPNYAARITKLSLKKKSTGMTLGVEPGIARLSELILKGWYAHAGKDWNVELGAIKSTNHIKLKGQPSAFAFWLIDRETHEIVDTISDQHGRLVLHETGPDSYSEESIRAMAKVGENDRIEYKQANLKNPQEPFNPNNIAKEIVAFANHEGGHILLGVDDDCEILGINDSSGLRDWVSNVAANNCKPAVKVDFRLHDLDGKKIAMIVVPKGIPGIAYQRSDGKTYVRRCGSSRPADPHEVQALVMAGQAGNGAGQTAFNAAHGL